MRDLFSIVVVVVDVAFEKEKHVCRDIYNVRCEIGDTPPSSLAVILPVSSTGTQAGKSRDRLVGRV